MNIPGGWELVLVAVLIMVLFGYKKLPDATRSLGRSMRIFKAETKGLRDEGDTSADAKGTAGSATVTAQPIAPAAPAAPAPVVPPHVVSPAASPAEAPPAAGAADAEQVQHRQP